MIVLSVIIIKYKKYDSAVCNNNKVRTPNACMSGEELSVWQHKLSCLLPALLALLDGEGQA